MTDTPSHIYDHFHRQRLGTSVSTATLSSMWTKVSGNWMDQVERPSNIVRWFMPSWFTVCMGTGILASCIGRIPYDIHAIRIIGKSIFLVNLVFFVLSTTVLLVQAFMYPHIFQFMRKNPRRMLHYGAIPMSMDTIVTGIVNLKFHKISPVIIYMNWTIWWVSVVLAILTSALMIYLIVSRETRSIENVTGAWLLLVAPLVVCAASGGRIALDLPYSQALVTDIVSYFLTGAGAPLICSILVLYLHRVAMHKLPPHDAILTSFIPLGPVGQIGVAAIALGTRSLEILPYDLPQQVDGLGTALFHIGIVVALCSWGSSIFWAINALFSVFYQRRSASIPFNISWWALTFPLGVFATLTVGLSEALEFRFFNICFLVQVSMLLLLWLFNVVATVIGVCTGKIFTISELESADHTYNRPMTPTPTHTNQTQATFNYRLSTQTPDSFTLRLPPSRRAKFEIG